MPLFTLSAWIYNEAGGDSRHSVLNSYWEVAGNNICFWSYDFADTYWRCSVDNSISYNKWSQIVTTWDGSVITHYVNGKLVWKDTNTSSGTSQVIVAVAGYGSRKMKGMLDDIRIYEDDLSEAQIQKLYAEELKQHRLSSLR